MFTFSSDCDSLLMKFFARGFVIIWSSGQVFSHLAAAVTVPSVDCRMSTFSNDCGSLLMKLFARGPLSVFLLVTIPYVRSTAGYDP